MTACSPKEVQTEAVEGNHYATGFALADSGAYCSLRVFSPWQKDSLMAEYILIRDTAADIPDRGIHVRIPVRRLVTASATHIGFMAELGVLDRLAGVCNPELVYHELPEDVVNTGDAMRPDVERVMLSGAEVMMISTYAQGDATADRMRAAGIPVICNNEWIESSPLARAEWIRFVAAFFDCLPKADSVFRIVDSTYQALTAEASGSNICVMSGMDFRGTWYVPTGKTYMGVFFRDAGADYAYADRVETQSIPLTYEQALMEFEDADVWVGCNARTLDELEQSNTKNAWFKSFKQGRVYNFYRRTNGTGANDFWESGVIHPERVLSDLSAIFRGDTTFYYAEKLK